MKRLGWGIGIGVVVLAAGFGSAAANGGLSLSISKPLIEDTPITFTASGIAAPPVSGESMDFVAGAVVRGSRRCPSGGADIGGDIPGTVVPTFDAFPKGPFSLSKRVAPTGLNPSGLVAGSWRHCVYLQDRSTNAVTAAGELDFTVRKAHVSVRVQSMPRHLKFFYDTQGRPNAFGTFTVRASSEVPLRIVQIGIERPGVQLPCTPDLTTAKAGISPTRRVTPGRAHTYKLRSSFIFKAGKPPYGQRVRACAIVGVSDPTSEKQVLEGIAERSLVISR
jgi:hypothetical protein